MKNLSAHQQMLADNIYNNLNADCPLLKASSLDILSAVILRILDNKALDEVSATHTPTGDNFLIVDCNAYVECELALENILTNFKFDKENENELSPNA